MCVCAEAGITYPGRGEKVANIDRLAIYRTTPVAAATAVVATNLQFTDWTTVRTKFTLITFVYVFYTDLTTTYVINSIVVSH